jgi:hypothetical protein
MTHGEERDEQHDLGMRLIKIGYDILAARLSPILEVDKKQLKLLKIARERLERSSMPFVLNLHGGGGVVPEGAVYIGDRLKRRPWDLPRSKWFNPYKIGRDGTRDEVIAKYERYLHESGLINDIHELRWKYLACWCKPEPCHGDVLLRLANAREDDR